MAETTSIINVKDLEKVEELKEDDTMLLIRNTGTEKQTAYRIEGSNFRGEGAYEVAVKAGYTGTREEWEAQCAKVAAFAVTYDAESGSIVITQ